MIRASFRRSGQGYISGFRVSGHAGFAEKGSDIVCAAVSALVINTVNSIDEFLPEDAGKVDFSEDEGKGIIEFKFDGEPSGEAVLLLRSLELGLKQIEGAYGKKYIEVK